MEKMGDIGNTDNSKIKLIKAKNKQRITWDFAKILHLERKTNKENTQRLKIRLHIGFY